MTLISLIAILVTVYFIMVISGVVMLIKGNKEKNAVIIVIGAFLVLGILGVVVAVMQINSWNKKLPQKFPSYQIQKKETTQKQDYLKKAI